jgi:hypothetical protein
MHWRQQVFRFPELPIPDGNWRPWSPEPRAPAVRDDPRICPTQVHGQLSWPSPPRTLRVDHAQRIMDRDFPELPALTAVIAQMTAERNLSDAWERLALHMSRLALAVREADQPLVSEQDIAQLPQLRGPLVEAFRRAGLLRRRPNRWHLALHPTACHQLRALPVLVRDHRETVLRLQELATVQRERRLPTLPPDTSSLPGTLSSLPRRRTGADAG